MTPPQPPADTPPGPAPKPRRAGLRKFRRIALGILLIIAVFHRPLFHAGLRLALIQIAHRQNLSLDVQFSGNIFTQLTTDHLRMRPSGQLPTPVQRIDIEHLQLDYSIPMLIKNGLGEFLRRYTIRNADLIFTAQPSKNPRDQALKRTVATNLDQFLAQPAGFADQVDIENFNLVIEFPDKNQFALHGGDLKLHPEQTGYLRIKSLQMPKAHEWRDLSAQTNYTDRNFFLHKLIITPDIVIDEANFDASMRARNRVGIILKGQLFGGTAALELTGSKLEKKGDTLQQSYDTQLSVELANVSLERFHNYFHLPPAPASNLAKATLEFRGEPEQPHTWNGHLFARLEALNLGQLKVESLELTTNFKDGQAQIQSGVARLGENTLLLTGMVGLPESVKEFSKTTLDATLKLQAPQFAKITAMLPDPWAGTVTGEGHLAIKAGQLNGESTLSGTALSSRTASTGSATWHLNISKRFTPPLDGAAPSAPPENLQTHLKAEFKALRYLTAAADTADLDIEMNGDLVTLHQLHLTREENAISANGTYRIPTAAQATATAPMDGQFSIQAPRLAAFGFGTQGQILSGHLQGNGVLKSIKQNLNGNITINGGDFQIGTFKATTLDAKIAITDNTAIIDRLELRLNGTDQIAAAGKVNLQAPYPYEGGAIVSVKDLAIFKPLLDIFGVKDPIKGSLQIDLNTSSQPPLSPGGTITQSGDLKVAISKAAYGNLTIDDFKLAGVFGTGFAQSSEFHIQNGPTQLDGSLEIREGKLRWHDIALQQGKLTVLTGFVILPLDLSNLKAPIPLDQHIAANVNAKNLDLDQLLTSFGQTSSVSGTFSANLLASGTPLEPAAHLKVTGRKLNAKATPQLAPSDLDLALHYSPKNLSLDAVLRQPQMQPLTVKGHLPLDLAATIQNKKLDPDLPLEVNVKLPASSLALAPKLSPAVRNIVGQASLDAHVGGTVAKPIFSGAALVNIQSARLLNENAPPIGGFQAHLILADEKVSFKTFRGVVGGGTFVLGGAINLAKLSEPRFDLRLRADHVLVKRDDTITVRIDTDLKLAGPLNTAHASGQVFVTDSRFFKEIDILPIGLPGRPKPKPRSAPAAKIPSFEKAPLRDWTFDIAIKTRPNDPFRIRGNLANGGAEIKLKFGGTGLHPTLEGNIGIENFAASLPFSKLTVNRGNVYFTQDAPFQPLFDIQAESTVRDYRVDAYIYGPANDPQISLTSEPPLPQAEVVSLLATGTTTSELTGNSNVLAGRAAVLVFQELYHKVFKKREPIDEQSLFDRFNLDVGAVDNRTGRQEISARFKLGDQLYLIGDLDVTGNFTGRLRYLLRFR